MTLKHAGRKEGPWTSVSRLVWWSGGVRMALPAPSGRHSAEVKFGARASSPLGERQAEWVGPRALKLTSAESAVLSAYSCVSCVRKSSVLPPLQTLKTLIQSQ